ncbi:MAG: methyltransferase type 12 [Spirochaetes bacterium GWD1_27_9]|nr:MAG: methyltransferase type 12 [Spirochaetes bacterium GWB1_27_13]OHD23720.1 MAG: methyltransferase type 12 [Spirochaetes bacterium GWC1_27_15]OHD42268.1 MAG: methyltransferase type 12 [Spirochaetes bacterium GWD1_27_9]
MESIKKHFDEEAKEYDGIILKLIPYYNEMLTALILSIPFDKEKEINVIDLGCGTGTISKLIKEKFVNAKITCVDFASKMIDIAKFKLKDYKDINYIIEDFYKFEFDKKYDIAVSSLALHHLQTDSDKMDFYKKIYQGLNHGGMFFNADVILSQNDYLQKTYLAKWKEYMLKSVIEEEIEKKWFPSYNNEDKPSEIMKQLEWLKEIGFKQIDIIWKYYNFAVYGGYKN